MSILADVQREIADKDLVTCIEARVLTPIMIGGYDTHRYHKELGLREPLRESSLKGVWRWWSRALIGAAIGRTNFTIKDLDEIASLFLGSQNECSKYSIEVELKEHDLYDGSIKRLKNLSCIKFAKVEEEIKNSIKPQSYIYIKLYRNKSTQPIEDKFAILSLIVSLVFEGIGKRTSRGFGKLEIVNIKSSSGIVELSNLLKMDKTDLAKIKEKYTKLIEEGVNAAKELLKLDSYSKKLGEMLEGKKADNGANLPLVETPDLERSFMKIKVFNKQFPNYIDALEAICCSVLKLYHKALRVYKNIPREKLDRGEGRKILERARSRRGYDVDTWILGLPRSQEPRIVKVKEEIDQNKLKDIQEKLSEALKVSLKSSIAKNEGVLNQIVEEFRNKVGLENQGIKIPTGYYLVDVEKGAIKDFRRKSPIRFTVTRAGNEYLIVMYWFRTWDWIIQGGKDVKLLHIGAEPVRKSEGSKTRTVNIEKFNVNIINLDSERLEDAYNKITGEIINLVENDLYKVICK